MFHGFDAGKPRHIYIRGFFDLYCTTGPRDTAQFQALADQLGHFAVTETGWPKIDPFMREIAGALPPVRKPPVILYHSTFSPSWSAAETLLRGSEAAVARRPLALDRHLPSEDESADPRQVTGRCRTST